MIYLIGIGIVLLGLALYGFYRWGQAISERKFAEREAERSERDKKIDSEPPVDDPMSGMHS